MDKNKKIQSRRLRRRRHVRNKLRGDSNQPRLCIERSLKHFACQVVDDEQGKTLVSASTRDKSVRDQVKSGGNCDAAAIVGKLVAERAAEAGIKIAQLDRGHNKYHGRVRAFADAAREAGLQF
ncbi:50S ribosomal protein L18 [Allorhodopirellula solitaria]|uniref:Large ribosomal subunit protein uL18 n=1 Tax=Allorhodopirellula solitaria TaxID=2527987 RepID=A0A5C5YG36_9BACT|nr:50S ribosomal protein L18 [Allorhodopirellula solitaria]TWT73919.1 50S ribosomal protein L18 [Allorhodopirellula solitaria]